MSVNTPTTKPAARPGRSRFEARAIADAAERLAAPSTVVSGVLELIGGSAPVRAIAGRVAQSPEVAAHVLRLANSALFDEPVDTLDRAIVRIGERQLRGLLLAASTYRLLEAELPLYNWPRLALLKHSTDVATAAQSVCSVLAPAQAPQAYLSGLMHDLGKAILAELTRDGDYPPVTCVHDERVLFGTDHARVATWIGRRWGLTDDICEAMQMHHEPQAPTAPLARSVWLADILVHAGQGDAAAIVRLPEAAASCGIDVAHLEDLLTGRDGDGDAVAPATLTDREMQVLRLLASGAAAKQAAAQLGCSVSTVHNHLHRVYRKLNVTGQSQALLMAREMGWV